MAKLDAISSNHPFETEAVEISHLVPLGEEEIIKRQNEGKNCWEKLKTNFQKFFCLGAKEEMRPICLRTDITMEELKEIIMTEESKSSKSKDLMSKYQKLTYPVKAISEMTDEIKNVILELTFSNHYSVKMDGRLSNLIKGKTIVGLYVWMCSYCFYHVGSSDQMFWDRFGSIVSLTIQMWGDTVAIMTKVGNLRDSATHIVRLLDSNSFQVPLEREAGKFRQRKEEMAKMKKFNQYKSARAWDSDLMQPPTLRILYSSTNSSDSIWHAFDLLQPKNQIKHLHGILDYVELVIHSVLPLLSKLKGKSVHLDKATKLDQNSESDCILAKIILDKLDLLTLSAKTLKLYVKEILKTIHACYEFCRYNFALQNTKTYDEIFKNTLIDMQNFSIVIEDHLDIHSASLTFNTDTYPNILQKLPLSSAQFVMVLQDLKDVFDFDALSVTTENDM